MCHTFDALLATLEEIVDSDDHKKAVEAKGLLLQVKSFLSFFSYSSPLTEFSHAPRDCQIFYKASIVT